MARPYRVLVIDDSEIVLEEIKTQLCGAGYDVVTTTQTVGVARHLRQCDLVIIDYHMPGLDGQSVLESLRAAADSSGTKPLFYLYTSDPKIAVQGRKLGFDGVFDQKGDIDALARQIDAAFRLGRLRALGTKPPPKPSSSSKPPRGSVR